MPSYPRKHQLTNSLVYHVFNRSNARVPIFNVEGDYYHFIKLLKDYSNRFNLKVYRWVIMSNHYHLLFEIEEPENISKLMAGLNRAYTHYYHKAYFTAGFLWQGRFKMQPVQKERYLIACGRYIERNPVRANIVLEAQDYQYSSAGFYCFGKSDGLTVEDPMFMQFGLEKVKRQAAYAEFLRNFDTEEERSFANLDTPQGDKSFIRKLVKEHGRYMPRRRGRTA
jgi:putative transposase